MGIEGFRPTPDTQPKPSEELVHFEIAEITDLPDKAQRHFETDENGNVKSNAVDSFINTLLRNPEIRHKVEHVASMFEDGILDPNLAFTVLATIEIKAQN